MSLRTVTVLLWMATMCLSLNSAEGADVGAFAKHGDVGQVRRPGQVEYDLESQTYLVEGAGKNMWLEQDEFHFLWKRMKGDFILRARLEFVGKGVNPHRKAGWIIRNSLASNAAHVNACVHGDGLTSLQFRKTAGGNTEELRSDLAAPDIVQLERRAQRYIMSTAAFGQPFVTVQISDVQLQDEVYVGLYVCSHEPDVSERAIFRNVRIITPAPPNFRPYQDYIGSRLELMDVKTGRRSVVYTDVKSIQAPNWALDGRSLVYNREGLLYRFDLASRIPSVINTDFAQRNNNDHVFSFDGKYLGISDHSQDETGQSLIYTLPAAGGKPRRVTLQGPSYLHGWSPDGKHLIYTGGRDDQYDIYRVAVSGGQETQLTNTKGLDDGSEYAPDGNTIYFNSNRTGTMQIWRMRPDGTNPEQMSFDAYHDWFPHVSPDGRWIAFLSFAPEVDSADHPFYKQVYLRLIPAQGGKPRIIAYVYGGQGTINVPSWSPDSTQIAFVSNTGPNE